MLLNKLYSLKMEQYLYIRNTGLNKQSILEETTNAGIYEYTLLPNFQTGYTTGTKSKFLVMTRVRTLPKPLKPISQKMP